MTYEKELHAFTQASECLRIMAHPMRLQLIRLLIENRMSVGECAEACGIMRNVTSEHLRSLQHCGLLRRVRKGRQVYYEIAEPHLLNIMGCIENRFFRPSLGEQQ